MTNQLFLCLIVACAAHAQVFVKYQKLPESDEDFTVQRSIDESGQVYSFSVSGKGELIALRYYPDCHGTHANEHDWAIQVKVRGPKAGHEWTAVLNSTSCFNIRSDEPSWKAGDLVQLNVGEISRTPQIPKVFTDDEHTYRVGYGEENRQLDAKRKQHENEDAKSKKQ